MTGSNLLSGYGEFSRIHSRELSETATLSCIKSDGQYQYSIAVIGFIFCMISPIWRFCSPRMAFFQRKQLWRSATEFELCKGTCKQHASYEGTFLTGSMRLPINLYIARVEHMKALPYTNLVCKQTLAFLHSGGHTCLSLLLLAIIPAKACAPSASLACGTSSALRESYTAVWLLFYLYF